MDINLVLNAIGDGVTYFSHGNAGARSYAANESFWHFGEMLQSVRPGLIWWSGSDAVVWTLWSWTTWKPFRQPALRSGRYKATPFRGNHWTMDGRQKPFAQPAPRG